MASYVVLARKWRPAQFSDIVGQGHIVRTLMNAIRAGRIHQAYLFTGSRGIGKTSIARIFAKAVRCEAARQEGDWLKSCDECAACKEITSGNGVDVIEIDGASNNGVDAVREIRENAKYLPAAGGRKIYIIDEVHMLTTAAFNALLKTLEEPPAHVIFIFATTEPHKIPATILSRCQRFDFRRVTMAQIQTRLTEVTKAEGIQAEPGALALIARAAEGSMRDSLSLLDQVIAFSGNQITVQSARESIGLIEGQTLTGILSGILSRKPLEALTLVEQAYQQGHDLRVLTRGLIEFLHGAILAKLGAAGSATLELSEDEWKELRAMAELRPLEEMEMIFQALHQGVDWIARSPQPKIVLDVLIAKCACAEALVYADSPRSSGGAAPSASGASPSPPAARSESVPTKAFSAAPVTVAAPAPAPMPAAAPVLASVPAPAPAPEASAPQAAAPAAPIFKGSGDPWEGFIAHVKQKRPLLASMLENGLATQTPGSGSGEEDVLVICFKPQDSYYKEQLQSRVYAEQLATFGKEFFGRTVRVRIELRETGETLAAKRERERRERETAARQAAQNHPIIAEARSLFGGELGPIELPNEMNGMGGHHARA